MRLGYVLAHLFVDRYCIENSINVIKLHIFLHAITEIRFTGGIRLSHTERRAVRRRLRRLRRRREGGRFGAELVCSPRKRLVAPSRSWTIVSVPSTRISIQPFLAPPSSSSLGEVHRGGGVTTATPTLLAIAFKYV